MDVKRNAIRLEISKANVDLAGRNMNGNSPRLFACGQLSHPTPHHFAMLTRLKSIRPARSITTDDVVYSARSARGNVLQWSTHAWENAGPWLRLAWQDVKADGKKTKWLRGLAWFFLMCLFGGALTVLSISPTLDNAFGDSNACLPDGTFSIEGHYNVWKPSNIFEVTLRSPSQYTFGEVKLIDTVWDVVGRPFIYCLVTLSMVTDTVERDC
jgi:hypothetical protein